MELHEIDLNLLVVFDQLRAERRVARVADNLGDTVNVSARLEQPTRRSKWATFPRC